MGVHICITQIAYDETEGYYYHGDEHPDWDYLRMGDDREFATDVYWEVDRESPDLAKHHLTDLGVSRPTQKGFRQLRDLIAQQDWEDWSKERYYLFCRILEENPDYWVHMSW